MVGQQSEGNLIGTSVNDFTTVTQLIEHSHIFKPKNVLIMKALFYSVLLMTLLFSCASLRKDSKQSQKVYLRFLPDVHKVIEEYINHTPDGSHFIMLDKGCDFENNSEYNKITIINNIPRKNDDIYEMYQNTNTFLLLNGKEIPILHTAESTFYDYENMPKGKNYVLRHRVLIIKFNRWHLLCYGIDGCRIDSENEENQ